MAKLHNLAARYTDWNHGDGLALIEAWARDGLTNEQIANNIGIHPSTLYTWQNKYPEISESLKRGKAVVDIAVENALFKRALGYEYTEVTKEMKGDTLVVTREITKEVAPDTTAQIFWLKNRMPEKYRDRKDVSVKGNINNPLEGLTTEELRKLIHDD